MRSFLRRGKVLTQRILKTKEKNAKARLSARMSLCDRLPKVRLAVAGAGKFARVHLDVLSSMSNVELVGVCNRGNSNIASLADEYHIARTFSDFCIMLDETKPDGVIVVVGHLETVAVTAECLRRGISCLIEKPAGLSSADTMYLAELAERNNCLNMVGVNRSYISIIQYALPNVLQRGPLRGIDIEAPEAIGSIRSDGRLDSRIYDLWLLTNGIHAIDLFRCLGGEILELHGFKNTWEEQNGDSFSVTMRLDSGCLGTYIAHWNSGGGWALKLYGDNVLAEISLSAETTGEILTGKSKLALEVDPIDKLYKSGLYVQDQAFISALALGERLSYPSSDLRDAVKTMKLIEQISNCS